MISDECVKKAKERLKNNCFVCNECDGKACLAKIPGPGGKGSGKVVIDNYNAWKNIKLVLDTISDVKDVNVETEILGKKISAPIICGPVGAVEMHYGNYYNDYTYNEYVARICKELNLLTMSGDGVDDQIMLDNLKLVDTYNCIIPTVKPWDEIKLKEKLNVIKNANPIAIAMDIDSIGLPFLKKENTKNKSVSDLKKIKNDVQKPFIIKGIMSVKGAKKAIKTGCDAIVVSNHGGRVLDCCSATADVLREIVKVCENKCKVFVDGGIRSGADIFKAIALGADSVIIARPIVTSAYGEYTKEYLEQIIDELKDVMKLCGAKDISSISIDMIENYK